MPVTVGDRRRGSGHWSGPTRQPNATARSGRGCRRRCTAPAGTRPPPIGRPGSRRDDRIPLLASPGAGPHPTRDDRSGPGHVPVEAQQRRHLRARLSGMGTGAVPSSNTAAPRPRSHVTRGASGGVDRVPSAEGPDQRARPDPGSGLSRCEVGRLINGDDDLWPDRGLRSPGQVPRAARSAGQAATDVRRTSARTVSTSRWSASPARRWTPATSWLPPMTASCAGRTRPGRNRESSARSGPTRPRSHTPSASAALRALASTAVGGRSTGGPRKGPACQGDRGEQRAFDRARIASDAAADHRHDMRPRPVERPAEHRLMTADRDGEPDVHQRGTDGEPHRPSAEAGRPCSTGVVGADLEAVVHPSHVPRMSVGEADRGGRDPAHDVRSDRVVGWISTSSAVMPRVSKPWRRRRQGRRSPAHPAVGVQRPDHDGPCAAASTSARRATWSALRGG